MLIRTLVVMAFLCLFFCVHSFCQMRDYRHRAASDSSGGLWDCDLGPWG